MPTTTAPLVVPGVRYLTTASAASDFFEAVMHKSLLFPAVVVTQPAGTPDALVPLDRLQKEVGDVADVYFLDPSLEVRHLVPERLAGTSRDSVNVYGGATRVFPAGDWDDAMLFLTRTREEGHRRVRAIAAHLRTLNGGNVAYSTSTDAPAPAAPDTAPLKVVALQAENADLAAQVAKLEAQLRAQTPKPAPKAPKTGPVPVVKTARRMFADAGDEIRFRVMALWAEQTSPQEKQESPLPKYLIGPAFAETVEELSTGNPALLDKIARCVLRVLQGQDRDGHKLDPAGKTREDGAVSWRAYVERSTASARRLHYWRSPGGQVELARVVLHDDYTI